jgi:hypothetical protein
MENNPWQFLSMDQMPQQQMAQSPFQQPQQPQQAVSDQYPTLPNSYGLGSQQGKQKQDQPNSGAVSTSPWLWTGESNSR